MHLELVYGTQFKRDLRKMQKQGKHIVKLQHVVDKLAARKKLEFKYKDHLLKGNYVGYRECHIEPDWLLIYKVIKERDLHLARTGSHSELFK